MPTAAGWRLLVLGVVVAIGGRALALTELHIIGVAAMAAVVAALLVRLLHPSRLVIERSTSTSVVAVGEPVDVSLKLVNWGRLRSPTVVVTEQISDGSEVSLSLATLPGGASTVGRYRLMTRRRGVLRIAEIRLDDVDGLGLARHRHHLGKPTRIVVHPRIEQLRAIQVPPTEDLALAEFTRRSARRESDDFDFLRPYVSGDDPRHIHWRSTARFGDLMMRHYQPARLSRLTVLIDTRAPGHTEATQDFTCSVAGSVALAGIAAGDEVRICTTDGRSTALLTQRDGRLAALEFLALLAGGSNEIDSELPLEGSLVVVVTAVTDVIDRPTTRARLAERLRASMVISCDSEPSGSSAPSARGPGADESRRWIHLTDPSQLPSLWRMPHPRRSGVRAGQSRTGASREAPRRHLSTATGLVSHP